MKQKRKTRRKRQNLTAICVTLAMIMSLFVGIPFTPITAHAAESKNIGTDVVYAAGDTIVLPDGGSYFKFDQYSNAEQKSGNSTVNTITNQYGEYYINTSGDWSSNFSLNGYNYSEYTSQGLVVIGIKFSGSGTSEDPYIPLLAYGELDAVWEGDGEGTESSPYLINNVNDLKTLADNVKSGMLYGGKYFKLTSDIDCGEENWEPIGGTNQFRGTFDGDGNTVTYHITDNSQNGSKGSGLFYGIAVSGTVKNLKVSGSIVGTSSYGNYYAGIAGINRGTIINCSSNVNITSPGCFIAGITGLNSGTISYCAASGSITWNGGSNSYAYVAGMTGENDNGGTVTNCTSLCDISAVNANGYSYASRVIGRNFGTVQNCYYLSSATVTGDHVGTNDATEKTTDELKEIGDAAYNAGYNVYGLALGYMPAPTIKTQPEDIELTYGYTEGSVSVEATTEKGLTLSYQWYSNSTNTTEGSTAIIDADNASYVIPVGKDAGTEEYYYCVVTASSMNASITTTSDIAKVTVKKADASVEVAPEAKTLTYTGSAQELVTAGSTNDGKIYYTVTTENKAPTDESLYSTSIPKGTEAGTYYVWYMVEGDENHEDISAECITVTISHKLTKHEAVEPTATKDGNITYWTCDGCGKFFSDEDGKTEIKEADTIIPATGETPEEPTPEEPTPEEPTPEEPTPEEPTPEEPTPSEPTPKGELSKVGIYCSQDNPSVIAAFLTKKSIETDTIEYRWVACESDNPNSWFIVSDWTKDNFYLSWTPEKDGDYVIVAQARLVGNEEETMVSDSFGVNYRTVKPKIKDICQIPVEDGYLIGIESTENPNQSLTYEMLILDLSLLADGNPDCWIYGVKGQTSEGNALWTIWKPQYGYYITLFRIYDENGNQLDQTAYGFVNAY